MSPALAITEVCRSGEVARQAAEEVTRRLTLALLADCMISGTEDWRRTYQIASLARRLIIGAAAAFSSTDLANYARLWGSVIRKLITSEGDLAFLACELVQEMFNICISAIRESGYVRTIDTWC